MIKFQLFTALVFISLSSFATEPAHPSKIVIIGDSLSAGFGVEQKDAFPAILEKLAKTKANIGLEVVNGGISGSTAASALSRVKWFAKLHPTLMIFELGGNDGLRGQSVVKVEANLIEAINFAKTKKISTALMVVDLPANYGPKYLADFKKMFIAVSKKTKTPILEGVFDKVAGSVELNQRDRIHPNEKGHEVIAQAILDQLIKKSLLFKKQAL